MTFKNLLVVLDDNTTSTNCLDAAISLAQAHDAHLTALHIAVEFTLPAPVIASIPAEILESQARELKAQSQQILDQARARANNAGISLEIRSELALDGTAGDTLARHARHVDLTLIGQTDPASDNASAQTGMIEAAFLDTGRPALAIPYAGKVSFPSQLAIVAWDGTREAARAMNDSLPLLKQAKEVRLITVDAEKLGSRVGEMPGADATLHLARHGIRAELRKLSSGGLRTGDAILAEIGDSGADLLVMGGYGHSRMREVILGGTTAKLLTTMTAATLLAH